MTFYAFIGVAVTSATVVVFGKAIWDPVQLMQRFHSPALAVLALITLTVATLSTNIAANVVSPANYFSNLALRLISFKTGGILTGIIGILMFPLETLCRSERLHFHMADLLQRIVRPDRRDHDRRLSLSIGSGS